jgi:tripartite-type tricarboxylate transporter receptor subunit TctC
MKRRVLFCGVLALAAIAASGPASAQAWPNKPVRVIVNYAPGGSTDNATRPFMEKLSTALGQQFVIENKSGAAGAIGVEAGTKSAPDGYTFFATPVATITILPNARKTPYDPFKDMVPVALYADSTLVFAVHPSIPANSVKEFVEYARKNPGKISFGSSGLGTLTQMVGETLNKVAGIDMLHVPYRGGAESMTDFLAGNVQAFSEGNVLPHVKAGKAKLLAVVDSERHPDFPDVPMMKEVYPEYDIINWFGMFAPAGTPDAIVAKMNEEINKVAKMPAIKEQLVKLALKPRVSTPKELGDVLKKDYDRYGQLVRDLKITLQ